MKRARENSRSRPLFDKRKGKGWDYDEKKIYERKGN